ncbi:MAG: hypothetical protein ACRELZ_22105 [Candidatus Rokuibacteriota bacterium]
MNVGTVVSTGPMPAWMCALTGVAVLGFGVVAHAHGARFRSIEGSWINDVKIVTCAPAPPQVLVRAQSMTTYMRGGTLVEGSASPAPPPAVSRGTGHGVWERTGHHTFRAFFRSHLFDGLGRLVRIVEVTTNPRAFEGDNPATLDVVEPYYLSGPGTNRITNLNPVDGSVISVTEGCNEATSRPILFED